MRARAAAASGSTEILSLVDGIAEIASENLLFLLPVFYALLDTAQIPAALIPSATDPINTRAVQIVIVLRAICEVEDRYAIPPSALMTCGCALDHGSNLWTNTERSRGTRTAENVFDLYKSLTLCALVGMAWYHPIDTDDDEGGLINVAHFLARRYQRNNGWDPDSFDALLTGTWGRMNLASLLVPHFNLAVPRSDSIIIGDTLSHLSGGTFLLCNKCEAVTFDTAFRDALRPNGFVTKLTTVAQALGRAPATVGAHAILSRIVATLGFYLASGSRHMDHGVSSCGTSPCYQFHFPTHKTSPGLAHVGDGDSTRALAEGDLLELCREFSEVAESRVQILDNYNAGKVESQFASDIRQVADSVGRIQLQLMKVIGGTTRTWPFALPLSPEFVQGLRAIV
ncbi:hypothetical protein C8R45DRAFT_1100996 [Mycena sanguinolenta]|nr:hypothetical protein C8R45DRAFT_1100996 [Mycena sanguinolenta]